MHARVSAGVQRPRCAVFVGTEEEATSVGSSLRNSLWGDHAIAVLLPTQGQDPTLVSSNFRRAAGGETFGSMAASRGASVLVAPASVARGLDFANVSYVYTLGVRVTEAAEYAAQRRRWPRVPHKRIMQALGRRWRAQSRSRSSKRATSTRAPPAAAKRTRTQILGRRGARAARPER